MGIVAWIWRRIFPPRAQTRTWMFLTFCLLVGIVVAGTSVYVMFVLRGEVEESTKATNMAAIDRVRETNLASGSDIKDMDLQASYIRMAGYYVAIMRGDSTIWHGGIEEYQPGIETRLAAREAILIQKQPYFVRQRTKDGRSLAVTADTMTQAEHWALIVQPEDPIHDIVRTMQRTLLLAMFTALILALVGSWIASGKVTKPLRAIQRSADSIARGQYVTRIRVHTRAAEIQDLAEYLNQMSKRYQEKIVDLEKLASMQNDFIGNVSHEVRNPIFAIGGYLEALKNPDMEKFRRASYAKKALLNLRRLSNLFTNLIDIAQLEYREDLLRPSVFNIDDLIREVIESKQQEAKERGIVLEADVMPAKVFADTDRIRRALDNLVENALVYGKTGPITCACRHQDGKARIEVSDCGPGIEPKHLHRIFERFYRVDPARTRRSGGSGLGLSIVKQIVQAHGETIHAESEIGRGSRFWFNLKLTKDK